MSVKFLKEPNPSEARQIGLSAVKNRASLMKQNINQIQSHSKNKTRTVKTPDCL